MHVQAVRKCSVNRSLSLSKRPVERESGFDTSTLLSTGKLSLREV